MEKLGFKINWLTESGVKHCVLRTGGYDLDISIDKSQWNQLDGMLRKRGFIQSLRNYNLNHICYRSKTESFDCRNLDAWNGITYLTKSIYEDYTKEDQLVHYICHDTLGKRHIKHPEEIKELFTKVDIEIVKKKLRMVWNQKDINFIIDKLKKEECFNCWTFVFEAILNHPLPFLKNLLRWIPWKLKRYPMVAFVGIDGSGKTTIVKEVEKELKEYRFTIYSAYAGRGQNNILPVNKIGQKIKKKRKWMYVASCPLFTLDLFLKYWKNIRPLRKKGIVLLDRNFSDILLMKNVPMFIKKFFYLFLPKPKYVFWIYRDHENVLTCRTVDKNEFDRQNNILQQINLIKIHNQTIPQTIEDIKKHLF